MSDLTNMLAPIEQASGLPNACYVDAAMFHHERDTLFRNNWAAIGFGKDISEPGMVRPVTFLGIPMIMVVPIRHFLCGWNAIGNWRSKITARPIIYHSSIHR